MTHEQDAALADDLMKRGRAAKEHRSRANEERAANGGARVDAERVDTMVDLAAFEGLAAELSASTWLTREIPEVDRLLGDFITTTSRAFLVARTGLGKTMLGLGLAMGMAFGTDFCIGDQTDRRGFCISMARCRSSC